MFRLDEDFQRNQRISYFLTTVFTLQKGVKRFIYVARKEKNPYIMVMSVVRQLK